MVDNLREHYGANYLATSGCGIGTNVEHSWVARFVRNPTQETDPLRHLLLLGLDGRNISDLATPPDPSPLQQLISKTRLMCENPACPNLGSKWRGETRLFRCPHTRRETVHMICHGCNQITALQVNEEAGSFHNWIVERGELWKISLRDFWTKPELSLREVARRLDADPLTIGRHAVKLGLAFPRKSRRTTRVIPTVAKERPEDPQARVERRTRWLDALKHASTIKGARNLEPSTYAWLQRHDKIWYNENRPVGSI